MFDLLNSILEHEFERRHAAGPAELRRPVARIDMHCHSRFSVERVKFAPRLTFNPQLEPEEIYDLAKSRGMNFVTITDHDTIDGCLALVERRGPLADFLFGEEVSVSFPEDGTLIHVNVYDIDERQHAEMQRLRGNIYEFVDYVRSIDKLYVLNHMTWNAQHRVPTPGQIAAMLRLFPVFEGINGTRTYAHNAFAYQATRGHNKIFIGGSDSHTNRMGTTYTLTEGATVPELLASIRGGVAIPCGEWGTAEKLREDVWLTIQKNFDRRIVAASGAWGRTWVHMIRAAGRVLHPVVCFGYTARQNVLIRDFARALPA